MLMTSANNELQPELSGELDLYTPLVANDARRPNRFLGQR
jgi:hypothetical protein